MSRSTAVPRRVIRAAALAEKRSVKLARKAERREAKKASTPRIEQFPSLYPDAPEDAAGVGRTLSYGGRLR